MSIAPLRTKDLKAAPRYAKLVEVLGAANRAVAHLNLESGDADHCFKTDVDDERIFEVIDWVEELVKTNIYQAAGRSHKRCWTWAMTAGRITGKKRPRMARTETDTRLVHPGDRVGRRGTWRP